MPKSVVMPKVPAASRPRGASSRHATGLSASSADAADATLRSGTRHKRSSLVVFNPKWSIISSAAASFCVVELPDAPHRTDFPRWRVHVGRIGAVLVCSLDLHLASHLETLVSDCLAHGGPSGDDADDASYSHKPRSHDGHGFIPALLIHNIITIVALLIAFVAVDPYRAIVFDDFEEEHTRDIAYDGDLAKTRDDEKPRGLSDV